MVLAHSWGEQAFEWKSYWRADVDRLLQQQGEHTLAELRARHEQAAANKRARTEAMPSRCGPGAAAVCFRWRWRACAT